MAGIFDSAAPMGPVADASQYGSYLQQQAAPATNWLQTAQSAGQVLGGVANLAALGNQPATAKQNAQSNAAVPAGNNPVFPIAALKAPPAAGGAPSPLPLIQPKTLAEILAGLSNGR
jgi:hypothetical protein